MSDETVREPEFDRASSSSGNHVYSGVIPAALIMGHHLAISALFGCKRAGSWNVIWGAMRRIRFTQAALAKLEAELWNAKGSYREVLQKCVAEMQKVLSKLERRTLH